MDYAKEYDRMVEQSNSQQETIQQLREQLEAVTQERDEWRIRFGNEEHLRRTEQRIQSVSYLLSDGAPALMPIISIKTVSDGRFVVVDNPCQEQLATVTKERDELKTWLEDQVCEAKDFAYKLEGKTVELATVTKERDALVKAMEHLLEYWNGDNNETAMHDALTHFDDVIRATLAKLGADKTGEQHD